MSRKVLIIDTSVLCCWLRVPGKDEAGPLNDLWNFKRIDSLIKREIKAKSTLVLPLATIIETGNHIAQSSGNRFECATKLADCIRKTADAETPWAAFTDQSELWGRENIRLLADGWPQLANSQISIGDATIKDVAEHYSKVGFEVEIITGDAGLKAYQPTPSTVLVPRRRK